MNAWIRLTIAIALISGSLTLAEDETRIYVYALRETLARAWLSIYCDGKVVAEVRRGAFFALDVSPGRHTLGLEDGVPASIELRRGEASFLRVDWHQEVGRSPIPVLSTVPSELADKELSFLSYADANRLRSNSVSRSDPRLPVQPGFKTRDKR